MAQRVVTVNDVLGGHTVLDIECLDRIYRAPRGALAYSPRSGHGLEEVSVGLMAYLDP